MRLTLRTRSYCDQPPSDPQVRIFDSFPIILGRSPDCDFCLSDTSHYVSTNHAVISLEDGQLLIQDTSTNGVYVNEAAEPIGYGSYRKLNHGDSLLIGDYLLSVDIDIAGDTTKPNASHDLFGDIEAGAVGEHLSSAPESHNPFGDDEPDWTPISAQDEQSAEDEWDWIDDPESHEQDRPAASSSGLRENVPFPVDDDEIDWPSSNYHEAAPGHAPSPGSQIVSEPPGLPGSDDHRQRRKSNISPSVPFRPESPAHSSETAAGTSAASLRALLRAASLRESDFAELDSTETLEKTGRLLVQMVDAMMELLKSRTKVKNFIRADITTLSSTDNNPLKFSVNAEDALGRLLSPETRGYLKSDAAIQEAVEDLKLHELAMLEGMRSAVRSLLLQFNPDKLAKTLEKEGGIAANIPITREAKLWRLFCDQYDAIREVAVNDFDELFDAEFRKAYEKRIKRTGRRPDF